MRYLISSLLISVLACSQPLGAEEPSHDAALQALAAKFFEWRRIQQPVGGDDIPLGEEPDEVFS